MACLACVPATLDALPGHPEWEARRGRAHLLERGLALAAVFERADAAKSLATRLVGWLQTWPEDVPDSVLAGLLRDCLPWLRNLGLRDELREIVRTATRVACGGQSLQMTWSRDTGHGLSWPVQLCTLLLLAGNWLALGENMEDAFAILDRAPHMLTREMDPRHRYELALAYADALGLAPPALAQARLERLFQEVGNVRSTLTTERYFSMPRLAVVEGVIQPRLSPCALGHPFREMPLDPAWLSWNGGALPGLAHAIFTEHRLGDMPVLADALEDAGCTDPDILGHLRGTGLHVPGCWVLSLFLGKP